MKKIYVKEWMELHPYTSSNEIDLFYTNIANKIYACLQTLFDVDVFKNDTNMRFTSLCIAAWFEDIISKTGIWTTFIDTCHKRYGFYLPFFSLNENYIRGDINTEDVRFILWHHIQTLLRDEKIIHPQNEILKYAASEIYKIIDEAYETAPENKQMQSLLCNPNFGKDDFFAYREILEWFHYYCYINIENLNELQKEAKTLFNDSEYDKDTLSIQLYGLRMEYLIKGRKSLLSLHSYEWLASLWKCTNNHELFEKVKPLDSQFFLYENEDEKFLYVKNLISNEKITIQKESVNLDSIKDRKPNQSVLLCSLIYYGDCWWQCGSLMHCILDEKLQQYIDEEKLKLNKTNAQHIFQSFIKVTNGNMFAFFKSGKEMNDFLQSQLHLNLKSQSDIPIHETEHGLILIATPDDGIYIQTQFCECIKSVDNSFYNQEEAMKYSILFYVNENVVPYEISCILQDKNMLPDACFEPNNGIHDTHFVSIYGKFITDYFFHKCREKDFSPFNMEILK